MAHALIPSTWEAEAGTFLCLRPAWSTEWILGQPGLYREILSQKKKKKKEREKNPKTNKQKNLTQNKQTNKQTKNPASHKKNTKKSKIFKNKKTVNA